MAPDMEAVSKMESEADDCCRLAGKFKRKAESSCGGRMSSLPHKTILMIGAVVEIALHSVDELVSSRDLADRLHLARRYLEPALQALVRV